MEYIHNVCIYGDSICIFTKWMERKNNKIYKQGQFSTYFYSHDFYNYVKKKYNVNFTIKINDDEFIDKYLNIHLETIKEIN